MDNSLRDAMIQMVNLQAQSLNAINQLTATVQTTNAGIGAPAIPPASALTNYASYAEPYQGPANPFAPSPQAQARFSSYAGQIAPNGMGDFAKQALIGRRGQMSNEQKELRAAEMGANITNAGIAGVGAIGSGIATFGGAMLPGFAASIAGGVLGGALGGAATAVALDQAQQTQAYNKFLLQNSYKFINPMESRNDKGIAGFSQSERWQVEKSLRHMDTKYNISDDQTMELLKGFTDGGLLKGASDLKTFEKKFGQLTEYVKQAALTLQTSFEDTTKLMAELEKRGILSENFDYFSASAKVLGSYLGKDPLSAMQSALNVADTTTSGTTADVELATEGAIQGLGVMGYLYEREKGTGSKAENAIQNLGGSDSAYQQIVASSRNRFDTNKDFQFLWGMLSTDQGGTSSSDTWIQNTQGKSYEQLKAEAEARYNRIGSAAANDLMVRAKDTFYSSDMAYTSNTFMESLVKQYQNSHPELTREQAYAMAGVGSAEAAIRDSLTTVDRAQIVKDQQTETKRQEALSRANAAQTGLITGLADSVGNFVGDMTSGFVKSGVSTAKGINAVLFGGEVDTLALSGASYTDKSVGKQVDSLVNASKKSGLKYDGISSLDYSERELEKKMSKVQEGSEAYNNYKATLDKYNKLELTAKGAQDVGTMMANALSGLGGFDGKLTAASYSMKYGTKDIGSMNAQQIENLIKGTKDTMSKGLWNELKDLSGRNEDKFLKQYFEDSGFSSLLGNKSDSYIKKLKSTSSEEGVRGIIESLMKDVNAQTKTEREMNSKAKSDNKEGQIETMTVKNLIIENSNDGNFKSVGSSSLSSTGIMGKYTGIYNRK